MWNTYETYQPDKGAMSTYFNYMIRNRMIDLMRKSKREKEKEALCAYKNIEQCLRTDIPIARDKYPIHGLKGPEGIFENPDFWKEISAELSVNQRKWVKHHIVEGLKLKENAEQEVVSVDAVKSWGRETRRKLRDKAEEGKLHL